MNKSLDLLFKILAFPWFGYAAFVVVMLSLELFASTSDSTVDSIVLIIVLFSGTAAVRFTFKSWKFKNVVLERDLLLDNLEEEHLENNENTFNDYKLSSVLAILAGTLSAGGGLWSVSSFYQEIGLSSLMDSFILVLLFVLITFGILLIYRAVMVLKSFSK